MSGVPDDVPSHLRPVDPDPDPDQGPDDETPVAKIDRETRRVSVDINPTEPKDPGVPPSVDDEALYSAEVEEVVDTKDPVFQSEEKEVENGIIKVDSSFLKCIIFVLRLWERSPEGSGLG